MTQHSELILLIEDDRQTRHILKSRLSALGWRIAEAETGAAGIASIKSHRPDLIVLDLGLPDMDGVEVVTKVRLFSQVPILILSARTREQDKIETLNAGADDYVTKPFGPGELEARIRALLRRISQKSTTHDVFKMGDLVINMTSRRILKAGSEVSLTPIEYRLLGVLIENADLVVTHSRLLKTVWGPEHIDDLQYLRIYMRLLRHKLESDPARPKYLITEVGVGYRLVGVMRKNCPNDCDAE
jgi:two-component system KDP operon response regulator KdpE